MQQRFRPAALRRARRAAKLTQAELAGRAGISADVIARAEQGRHVPASEALATIAAVLGMDWRDLFEADEPVAGATA